LPSVRKKALGKEPFADEIFAECSLPSVTLGKAFAECKIAFAEYFRHSAKNAIPVVQALVETANTRFDVSLHNFMRTTWSSIYITDHASGHCQSQVLNSVVVHSTLSIQVDISFCSSLLAQKNKGLELAMN
jgi:hypothetical protein